MKLIKNKTITAGIILLLIMVVLTACTEAESQTEEVVSGIIPLQTYTYTAEDLNEEWNADDATAQIALADDNTTITGSGASYENGVLTISSAGTFVVSGSLSDGQILIDASDSDTVRLVLNGVNITNKSAPALFEMSSDMTIVTLTEDSKNTLTDGASYSTTGDSDPDACLYATHDLSINGQGELVVNGNYNNAIGTQDDLVVVSSKVTVTAVNNGLKGRDLIAVKDATLNVDSKGDGLKSNNDQSATKGYIQIDSGAIDITAVNDGIQAETNLIINGGDLNVTTTGTIGADSATSSDSDSQSMKALKATSQIAVNGGNISIDSTDDGVHSNGNITINGGTFTIATDDDGIHADYATVINGGTIDITDSYEGIEGETVKINGGDISMIASNDGINAAGGSTDEDTTTETDTDADSADDRDQGQGPMGQDNFGGNEENNENNDLTISDGNLTIVSQGDGLDSNGDLYIEGGTIKVSTMPNGAEGPVDANGGIYMNGGLVSLSGNTSMAESPADDSKQNSLIMVSSTTLAKDSAVYVVDSDGNVVIEHTAANDYQMLILSSPDLKDGETYSVCSGSKDNVVFEVTLSGVNTIVDESGQAAQLNGMGGMGGGGQS